MFTTAAIAIRKISRGLNMLVVCDLHGAHTGNVRSLLFQKMGICTNNIAVNFTTFFSCARRCKFSKMSYRVFLRILSLLIAYNFISIAGIMMFVTFCLKEQHSMSQISVPWTTCSGSLARGAVALIVPGTYGTVYTLESASSTSPSGFHSPSIVHWTKMESRILLTRM
jgi:hypothetical protein